MDWFIDLIRPGNDSLASTILLYSFVIFAGIYLGKLKIFGVSLGVTFVLFVGILLGHFGYSANGDVLHFLREFGLILFIFSIGMQVGPGFFSSFKEGGIAMNMLALLGIGLNVAIMLAIFFIQGGSTGDTSVSCRVLLPTPPDLVLPSRLSCRSTPAATMSASRCRWVMPLLIPSA